MSAAARSFWRVKTPMKLNPHAAPFEKGSGSARSVGMASKAGRGDFSRTIFCDLDGVLCDFDRGCVRAMGTTPDKLSKKAMWKGLVQADGFYDHLHWMTDGRDLWAAIADLKPTILTGLPMGNWAEPQKRKWCKRELGEGVPVITCMSRDKHRYCTSGSVLIDDRLSLKDDWEHAGGVFIHHTSAATSLEELMALIKTPPTPDSSNREEERLA